MSFETVCATVPGIRLALSPSDSVMVVGLLLALLTPVQPSAAGGYEVIWDSWFPEQCRQFGDNTTSADFERFGITFNEKLSPGIPALPPQHPSGDTGRAGDRFVLFYENFGAATLRVSLSQCSTAMVPRPAAAPPLSPAWIFAPPVGLYPAIGAHAGNFSGTSLYMCDPQQVRSMNPCLRAMSVAAGPVSGDRNAGCTAVPQIVPGQPHWCNGGVPQRANLTAHAAKIRSDIEIAIPDPEWDGLAFIDYESWQPVRQGTLSPSAAPLPMLRCTVEKPFCYPQFMIVKVP